MINLLIPQLQIFVRYIKFDSRLKKHDFKNVTFILM
jgi:hypothetical protein